MSVDSALGPTASLTQEARARSMFSHCPNAFSSVDHWLYGSVSSRAFGTPLCSVGRSYPLTGDARRSNLHRKAVGGVNIEIVTEEPRSVGSSIRSGC